MLQELTCDMFSECMKPYVSAICITSNGYRKRDGRAVMGRGCAKVANDMWNLSKLLGDAISKFGNVTQVFASIERKPTTNLLVLSFPVKPVQGNNILPQHRDKFTAPAPGWACYADLNIVRESARGLMQQITKLVQVFHACHNTFGKVLLPRPGCYNGGLAWEDVKPILEVELAPVEKHIIVVHKENP